MHERRGQRQRHRKREKQAPCKKPDAGLDPRTPGSCPKLKADAQPLNHPGPPFYKILTIIKVLLKNRNTKYIIN